MKYFLFNVLLLPLFCFSQTLLKKTVKSNYIFTEIPIKIGNGHGDEILVKFSASIPKEVWINTIKASKKSEKSLFELIASGLSFKAQHLLKNTLSFEPFKTQFFSYINGDYLCSYGMMGRNDLGNMKEISFLVSFEMPLFESQIHINLDSLPKIVSLPKIESVKSIPYNIK